MNIYKILYGYNVSVRIERNIEKDIATVTVLAPMYKNTEWKMNHCYSLQFSDVDILNDSDFNAVLMKHYKD